MSTLGDLAVSYAARGWAVFPCQVGGKQPATRSGVYAGTDDLVTVRRYWRTTPYNIGIWTGASSLVVIDLDVDKKNPCSWNPDREPFPGPLPGISWWVETCERSGTDPFGTYCVTTAAGGLHVYYRQPSSDVRSTSDAEAEIHPSVGKLSQLVDVRAMGSYVIAAGSITDAGPYEQATDHQIAVMPEWLVELTKYRPPSDEALLRNELTRQRLEYGQQDVQRYVERRIRNILDAWVHNRNNTLNEQSYGIFMITPSRDHDGIEIALVETGMQIGLSRTEATATVRSARRGAELARSQT